MSEETAHEREQHDAEQVALLAVQAARKPAADWDLAYEAVYTLIRTLPGQSDRAATRNAVIWRAVHRALEATNPIQPCGRRFSGEPEYDVEPIHVTVGGEETPLCPRCSNDLRHWPTHDESIDGMGLMAVPDVYDCERCTYSWSG